MAGLGAGLATTSAYVLAGELGRSGGGMAMSFEAYQRVMRPLDGKAHDAPEVGTRLMNPRTRVGMSVLHWASQVATSRPAREIAARS